MLDTINNGYKNMNNNNNILPNNLNDILIGLMLGDGHIYKTSPTSNSRFEMSFGKDRELFADWVGGLFRVYSNTGVRRILVNKSLFNPVFNYRFKTRSLPIFNYYHDLFYLKNNETWKYYKVVPSNIKDFINPVVLAYLIMSDGNFDKSINRVRIYTNSYSKQDVERIASAIQSNLNIYVGVLHDRKDQWILTIGAQQLDELRNLVSPHF